jgi:lipid II isoglutaminyl synthase (glutamine-hydrolysing)
VTARFALARAAGATAAGLSRLTGRGGGTTIGGRVTLLVDPNALAHAAAGRELALVTGTNGKTTTRSFLVAALRTRGAVVSNAGGANLPTGLTAALTADRDSAVGVLEVDEPFLPRVAAAVHPRAVVLLNLSRDQLDRYAEVRRLAGIWREALTGTAATVVANADDPLVAWAAGAASDVVWVAAGQGWTYDSTSCPACGDILRRDDGGGWRSEQCGLARPAPDWSVDGGAIVDPDGRRHVVELSLPGQVNVGNAALAVAAAARVWHVDPDAALAAMAAIPSVEGRYLETNHHGRPVRLLLAKNPAGWSEALRMSRPDVPVVVAVNARAADGRDPSWLWDVPFEGLRGRHAIATGERSRDVAVRLRYAGVDHVRVDGAAAALAAAQGSGPVEILANYTAFQTYRKVLSRRNPRDD